MRFQGAVASGATDWAARRPLGHRLECIQHRPPEAKAALLLGTHMNTNAAVAVAVRGESRIAQLFHELHPKPGRAPKIHAGLAQRCGESVSRQDGTTTSKASAGSPSCAPGSLKGPITLRYSQNVHGQPCERISGLGLGPLPRTWMKWIGTPSISVRNCGYALIARSCLRQS
jgi:hypothetical protein